MVEGAQSPKPDLGHCEVQWVKQTPGKWSVPLVGLVAGQTRGKDF